MKKSFLISLFLLCFTNSFSITTIIHQKPASKNDNRLNYYLKLLTIALDNTKEEYGDYKIKESHYIMVQSRIIKEVGIGDEINIIWTMTSKKREDFLLPIRIPLLKGLLGYRIFIIRDTDQYIYDKINSLEDLKKLKAGQGHDWPDTKILEASGFNVVQSPKYESLFNMLKFKRFDYFLRGINEP